MVVEYLVEQYSDDLIVYRNGVEYIRVKRKFNWGGWLLASYFYKGKEILNTRRRVTIGLSLRIDNQDLPEHIELVRSKKGKYSLHIADKVLSIKRAFLKNPCYTFLSNDEVKGYVNTATFSMKLPYTFNVFFQAEEDINFYLLLFFLMDQAPVDI
ncbi:hypothetical protein [Chitinophaga barathri]|uniref:Uncharacterized protein n=1 Tax=Chitinophaga barathri TaxID=1647451 RepID=A0A3N4ME98_9BACT|nr:hypothetical protein [Chitinophaga barathri]RPD41898.1 hypothetical protein EG028_06975 [Chitinophaga barathri]